MYSQVFAWVKQEAPVTSPLVRGGRRKPLTHTKIEERSTIISAKVSSLGIIKLKAALKSIFKLSDEQAVQALQKWTEGENPLLCFGCCGSPWERGWADRCGKCGKGKGIRGVQSLKLLSEE